MQSPVTITTLFALAAMVLQFRSRTHTMESKPAVLGLDVERFLVEPTASDARLQPGNSDIIELFFS